MAQAGTRNDVFEKEKYGTTEKELEVRCGDAMAFRGLEESISLNRRNETALGEAVSGIEIRDTQTKHTSFVKVW